MVATLEAKGRAATQEQLSRDGQGRQEVRARVARRRQRSRSEAHRYPIEGTYGRGWVPLVQLVDDPTSYEPIQGCGMLRLPMCQS